MWVEEGHMCRGEMCRHQNNHWSFFFSFFKINNTSTFLMTVEPRMGPVHSRSLASYPKWKAFTFLWTLALFWRTIGSKVQQWSGGGKSRCVNLSHGSGLEWVCGPVFLLFLLSSPCTKMLTHHLNHRLFIADWLWNIVVKACAVGQRWCSDYHKSLKCTVERCHAQHV